MSLDDAFAALALGFGASAGALSRHHRNEARPRSVALFDIENGSHEVPSLRRPLAPDALDYMYRRARFGSVWFLNDLVDDRDWSGTQTLANWRTVRDMKEVVVFVLDGNAQHSDFIELHFSRVLERSERLEIEALTKTLLRSWRGRSPGLVTQNHMDNRMVAARNAANANRERRKTGAILGTSNPMGLSRAEFQICVKLSRGLTVKAIVEEKNGPKESTVRKHLSAIYHKTETVGMPELLYRLLSSNAENVMPEANQA